MSKPFVEVRGSLIFKAYMYEDGIVWIYRNDIEDVRVPEELANVLKARLAMGDDTHDAMRDTWWCSIAYWRRYGVTNTVQVGNAIDANPRAR